MSAEKVKDFLSTAPTSVPGMETITRTATNYGKSVFDLIKTGGIILGVILVACSVIAYLLKASNPVEREDAKKTLIHRLIAIVILFAIGGIIVLFANLGSGLGEAVMSEIK